MANYKEIKGFFVQTRSSDPVPFAQEKINQPYAGSWSSGGDMNQARSAMLGGGSRDSNIQAGGTNPSLVEAMNLSLPIIAFDCNFNRYTTENNCIYFSSSKDLKYKLSLTQKIEFEKIKRKMKSIAKKRYNWNKISDKYLQILRLGKLND